jgi:hypothetical protein
MDPYNKLLITSGLEGFLFDGISSIESRRGDRCRGYFFSLVVGVLSMRVALVIGTRPQIIKSAPIVHDVKE